MRANSKVGQISKFCEVFFNLRLVDCPHYAALTDLQKIRDCIVLCLGDVNLSGDKDYLEKLEGKRPGFYAHAQGQIYIYEKCIQQFFSEVWTYSSGSSNSWGGKLALTGEGKSWAICSPS